MDWPGHGARRRRAVAGGERMHKDWGRFARGSERPASDADWLASQNVAELRRCQNVIVMASACKGPAGVVTEVCSRRKRERILFQVG